MPTVPILKTSTVNVYLFLLILILSEYDRRLHLLIPQILKINVLEERMLLYLLSAVLVP